MANPFSCEECRAQIALLSEANLRTQPNLASKTNAPEIAVEALSHLKSCAACQFEYSMLRGIVSELHALPFHAAPPELRGRIRAQIARESAASPAVSARRSFLPRFAKPRFALPNAAPKWATLSFSGALVTACLLFLLAREPQLPLSSSAPASDGAISSTASSNEAAKTSSGVAKKPAKKGKVLPAAKRAQAFDQNAASKQAPSAPTAPSSAASAPADSATSTGNLLPDAPQNDAASNTESSAPLSDSTSVRNSSSSSPLMRRSNTLSEKATTQNSIGDNAASSNGATRFAQLDMLPTTASSNARKIGAVEGARTSPDSTPSGGATSNSHNEASSRAMSSAGATTSSPASSAADSAAPSVAEPPTSPSSNAASSSVARPSIQGGLFRNGAESAAPGARAPRNGESLGDNDAPSSENAAKRSNDNGGASFSAPVPANSPAPPSAASSGRASKTSSTRNDNAPSADSSDSIASDSSASDGVRQSADTARGAGKNADAQRDDASRDVIAGSLSKSDARSKTAAQQRAASRVASDSANKGLDKEAAASANNRARLTIVPRQSASSARVVVQWDSTSKSLGSTQLSSKSAIVWRGEVRRNRAVVVIVSVPRDTIGNKKRRVQVSLQVLQGTDARGTWKTVDSTTLSPTAATR